MAWLKRHSAERGAYSGWQENAAFTFPGRKIPPPIIYTKRISSCFYCIMFPYLRRTNLETNLESHIFGLLRLKYYCCSLGAKSCLTLVTLWTGVLQAPLSIAFQRQEYWSGLPFPSPGDLPDPGIKPATPVLAGGFFTTEPPEEPLNIMGTHRKSLVL